MTISPATLDQRRAATSALIALCAACAVVLLYQTRYLFLDDAFIHLRIASHLARDGLYSFNGDQVSFGTSSPLYTLLLAILWKLWPTSLLPKLVNIPVYVALFATIASFVTVGGAAWSATGQRKPGVWIAVLWLAITASPFAIRWLTDGMETGLVALSAVWLGVFAARLIEPTEVDRSAPFRLFLLTSFAAWLRVEFAYLSALVCAACLAQWWLRRSPPSGPQVTAVAAAVGGSAVGLLLIVVHFGHLLPDTAVAKVDGGSLLATIMASVTSHAGASLFGVGTLVCLVFSFFAAARRPDRRPFVLVLNAGFLLFLILVALRHQAIQGYRYFVFIEAFLISTNIGVLQQRALPQTLRAPSGDRAVPGTTIRPAALMGALALVVAWYAIDWHLLEPINAGRSATYLKFSRLHAGDLHGMVGLAWDVGMVGFFTDGTILDAHGLVDGRMIARLSYEERLRRFTARPISFVFGNRDQLQQVQAALGLRDWVDRGDFIFPNLSGKPDTHYLLVRPAVGGHDAAGDRRADTGQRHHYAHRVTAGTQPQASL